MTEQPVKCDDCPKLVTPQKTWSDRNGNQGKLYVMCKGTTEQPHPQWFRFISELAPSPTLPSQGVILGPSTYDPWIMPAEIKQPQTVASASGFDQTTCSVTGCDKRINQKCARHACAGHCRIQGGCHLAAHGSKNSELSQVPPATFPSQSSALTWGIGHVFIPTTQHDPLTPISNLDYAQNATNVPTGYEPPPPIPPCPIQPIISGPCLEPPASMNPLPNPRYSSQIRPIFTEELAQKQELLRTRQIQDAERLEAANRAKHEVTVCAWLSDNEEPQSCIFQGDFIWPNFVLKASVLSDVGLVLGLDKPWFKVYNHTRKLWERVRLNHVISVQGRPEILLKALDVNVCQDFSKFTAPPSTTPHIRHDLQRERESVKQKGRKRFLEVGTARAPISSRKRDSTSPSCGPSTKRPRRQSRSPHTPLSHYVTRPHHSQRWKSQSRTLPYPPFHDDHQGTSATNSRSPISISSSAPSSPAGIPDVLEFTDSDSGSGPSFRSPMACHRHPVDVVNITSSPQASIKQEGSGVRTRRTPRRTPRWRDSSTFSKRWPSDYHVVDVANILEACTPPPPGMTTARVFESHIFQTFKPSTFYDTRDRWNTASQEDRDTFENYGYTNEGLWSVFASWVPMKNATVRAARQRQTRLASRTKTKNEGLGEADSIMISSEDDSCCLMRFNKSCI